MLPKLSRCEGIENLKPSAIADGRGGYGEIADTLALGASGRKAVGVQILLPAQKFIFVLRICTPERCFADN